MSKNANTVLGLTYEILKLYLRLLNARIDYEY